MVLHMHKAATDRRCIQLKLRIGWRLTDEWQAVGDKKYRIVDREAYEVQMRELLGIA